MLVDGPGVRGAGHDGARAGPGHLGARRGAAGARPGPDRRPAGAAGRCSTSGPTTSWRRTPTAPSSWSSPVTNRAAFRSFVLSFLEHAEILDPPELRDDLVAWLS